MGWLSLPARALSARPVLPLHRWTAAQTAWFVNSLSGAIDPRYDTCERARHSGDTCKPVLLALRHAADVISATNFSGADLLRVLSLPVGPPFVGPPFAKAPGTTLYTALLAVAPTQAIPLPPQHWHNLTTSVLPPEWFGNPASDVARQVAFAALRRMVQALVVLEAHKGSRLGPVLANKASLGRFTRLPSAWPLLDHGPQAEEWCRHSARRGDGEASAVRAALALLAPEAPIKNEPYDAPIDTAQRPTPEGHAAPLRKNSTVGALLFGRGRWPRRPFADASELRRSRWATYLELVYGEGTLERLTSADFPLRLDELWTLHGEALVTARLVERATLDAAGHDPNWVQWDRPWTTFDSSRLQERHRCEQLEERALFFKRDWNRKYDAEDSLFVYHARRTPLPNHTWAEVTHCSEKKSSAAALVELEADANWMFYAPGSGMFWNVGRTAVFVSHAHAARWALPNATCLDASCFEQLNRITRAARKRGFDSIQFLQTHDQRCGNVAIEIVDVKGRGDSVCGTPSGEGYRTGWRASLPCGVATTASPSFRSTVGAVHCARTCREKSSSQRDGRRYTVCA